MSFKDFLQISASEIDSELESFFADWGKDVEHISPRLLPFIDVLVDGCRGGKRIRGALVKLGYEMGQGKEGGVGQEILKVAAAVEIFQMAILCHDDIIDKSLLRRGKPSMYARLGGDYEGISKAICLGDIGYFLVFQIISKSGFPERQKNILMEVFSKMMLETTIGELLDFELTVKKEVDDVVDSQEVINVYKYKTAHYTISGPLLIGAVLGGLKEEQIRGINIFGHNLGIAFQIQDDINDIFLERDKLGKDPGGDIKEGKQTLLYLYAREHTDGEGKKILDKYFGKSELSDVEIGKVKDVFQTSGALEYAKKQVEEYAKSARGAIGGVSRDGVYREMLSEMTDYFLL
jgi:geranylgeranyl diphosphate synthase type I